MKYPTEYYTATAETLAANGVSARAIGRLVGLALKEHPTLSLGAISQADGIGSRDEFFAGVAEMMVRGI